MWNDEKIETMSTAIEISLGEINKARQLMQRAMGEFLDKPDDVGRIKVIAAFERVQREQEKLVHVLLVEAVSALEAMQRGE